MTLGQSELSYVIAILAAVVIGLPIVEMRRGGRAKVPIAHDHDHDHHRIIRIVLVLLLLGIRGPAGRQGPQGPTGTARP